MKPYIVSDEAIAFRERNQALIALTSALNTIDAFAQPVLGWGEYEPYLKIRERLLEIYSEGTRLEKDGTLPCIG